MPESAIDKPRFCSQCGRAITVADASFCKECGAPLAGAVWLRRDVVWRPARAFFLSVIPGLGHWYKGQRKRAFGWLLMVWLAYAAGAGLGLLIHFICALNAGLSGVIRERAFTRAATRGISASGGTRL